MERAGQEANAEDIDTPWDETREGEVFAANDLDMPATPVDTVRLYFNDVGKVALLDAEQEVELAKRVEVGLYAAYKLGRYALKEGDTAVQLVAQERTELLQLEREGERAKATMVEANLRLVVSLAKRYTDRGLDLPDLIQEGSLGLIRAVEKFDYTKGFKFSSYATWWIRQSIVRGLASQSRTIRLPVHQADMVNKMGWISRELFRANGGPPSLEELATEMDITVERVVQLKRISRDPLSIDQLVGEKDSGSGSLGDFIQDSDDVGPEDWAMLSMLQADTVSMLRELKGRFDNDERYATVITMRYGLLDGHCRSLDYISKALGGVRRARVRQMETEALKQLREMAHDRRLQDFYFD